MMAKKLYFYLRFFPLYTAPKLSLTYVRRTCQVHIHFPCKPFKLFQIVYAPVCCCNKLSPLILPAFVAKR